MNGLRCRLLRWALLFAASVLAVPGEAPAQGARAQLRVEGHSELRAMAIRRGEDLVIRGHLSDDRGRAIERARVAVTGEPGADGQAPSLPKARRCDDAAPASHAACKRGSCELETDDGGDFCVSFRASEVPGPLLVAYQDPKGYFGASSTRVPIDNLRRILEVSLGRSDVIEVENERHTIRIDTQTTPPFGADETRQTVQLEFSLGRQGAYRHVGTVSIHPGEGGEFVFDTRQLGPPGPTELVVRYPGSDEIHPYERRTPLLMTAEVKLSVAGGPAQGDPTDGIPLRVAAGSVAGPVAEGSVEARLGLDIVGIAPVHQGAATLELRFAAERPGPLACTLHYVPTSPWWRPARPLSTRIEVQGPSPWRSAPWILSAALVLGWLLTTWQRPGRKSATVPPASRPAQGRAGIEVVQSEPGGRGWRGTILDAHDETPIEGALVEILVPSLSGAGTARTARADRAGTFLIAPLEGELGEGVIFRVSARWHGQVARALPCVGVLRVAMVLRRRGLVDRLTEWARFASAPWNAWIDPTPGLLKREAMGRGAKEVADWAAAVEVAAYGLQPVDEVAEKQVRALEPKWSGTRADGPSAETKADASSDQAGTREN